MARRDVVSAGQKIEIKSYNNTLSWNGSFTPALDKDGPITEKRTREIIANDAFITTTRETASLAPKEKSDKETKWQRVMKRQHKVWRRGNKN